MRGLIKDTYLELLDRKVIYVFAVITLLWIIGAIGSRAIELQIQGQSFNADDIGMAFRGMLLGALNMHMYILVFITAMTAASVIPRMFVRGRADYYLSKPISRTSLLLKKTLAILIVYGALMLASFFIDLIAVSLSFGFFEFGMIYIIAIGIVSLFIWLTVTTIAGIATGSYSMSIIAAFLVWIAQWILGFQYYVEKLIDSKLVVYTVKTLYYIVPKTSEISGIAGSLAEGDPVDLMPLWSSVLFAFVALAAAVMIFHRKDY